MKKQSKGTSNASKKNSGRKKASGGSAQRGMPTTKARRAATSAAKRATVSKPATRKKHVATTQKKAAKGTKTSNANSPASKKGATATSQDPIQFPEQRQKKVKTHLSAKELRGFKELLLHKREELAGDVERLTSEALRGSGQGDNDHTSMPIHMADVGSDAWEQDFTLGLIANEESRVREIDDALERIADRTYGVCLATHKKITDARLRAKPWAKYCIDYARMREEGRAP